MGGDRGWFVCCFCRFFGCVFFVFLWKVFGGFGVFLVFLGVFFVFCLLVVFFFLEVLCVSDFMVWWFGAFFWFAFVYQTFFEHVFSYVHIKDCFVLTKENNDTTFFFKDRFAYLMRCLKYTK